VTGSETTDIVDVAPTHNDAVAVVTIIDDGVKSAALPRLGITPN
jgi:hypothetical protein